MTNIAKTDIDIDVKDRDVLLEKLKHIPASIIQNGEIKKHNTGVYFTDIPVHPFTNTANIDYKQAEDRGYFKVDFLNVSIYEKVKNEKHLIELMTKQPMWQLLEAKDFSDQVFHLNGHSTILQKLKPTSIEQLAAVLAIIRPSNTYLINKSWDEIMKEVWVKPKEGYFFKKSHATSYAVAVVVHMNLICEQLNNEK